MPTKTPAKRTYQRRKNERPGEILAAAFKEFCSHGYVAANLDQIAAAANVSKGTIYHYFDTKHDLFEAVISLRLLEPLTVVDTPQAPIGSLSENLSGALWLAYESGRRSEATSLLRTLLLEGQAFPELRNRVFATLADTTEQVLQKSLEHGLANGDIAISNVPKSLLSIVFPSLCAMALRFENDDGFLALDDIVEWNIAVIVSALTDVQVSLIDPRKAALEIARHTSPETSA